MLNRKISPVHFQFPEIQIPQPEISHLKNGIPLFVFNSTTQPVVKLEIILRNGGNKTDLKVGTSFLISKTLQSGTKSYSAEQITNLLAQRGAFLEVSSTFDYSIITLYSLTKHLKSLLPLIHEITYAPIFPEQELELQKKILIAGLRTQNKKTSVLASKYFRQSIMGAESPYGKIIKEEDLHSLSATDISTAYANYFSNVEIIVNGDISQEIISAINNTFSSEYYSSTLSPIDTSAKADNNAESRHLPIEYSVQTSIRIGKSTIKKSHPDFHKLQITNHLLGGYFGSRLMSNIREEKGLTYGIYSSIVSLNEGAYFVIGSDVNGKDKELAIDEIKKELDQLQHPIKFPDELTLVKNHMVGSFQSDLSSPLSLSDKFKSIHLSGLEYQYYYDFLSEIRAFSEEDMAYIGKSYLNSSNLYCITAGA